jgi:uncharacterized membrane protein
MEGGTPIHPALVHLPLGLAMVMPFLAAVLFYFIKKGRASAGVWWIPVILQILVIVSAFGAMRAGEAEEDIVENVVQEKYIEEHEEAGKIFLLLSFVALVSAGAALKESRFTAGLQAGSVFLMIVSLGAGLYTGKLGGELVYKHGAGGAYSESIPIPPAQGGQSQGHEDHDHDED